MQILIHEEKFACSDPGVVVTGATWLHPGPGPNNSHAYDDADERVLSRSTVQQNP